MGQRASSRREWESWEEAVRIARKAGLDFDERDIASISKEYRDRHALLPRFLDPTHDEKFDYNIIKRITTIFKHRLECIEPMVMMYINRYYAQLTASARRGYAAKHIRHGDTVLLIQHPTESGCHLGRGALLPEVKGGKIVMTWCYGVMARSRYRLLVKVPSVRDGILLEGCGASVSNPS